MNSPSLQDKLIEGFDHYKVRMARIGKPLEEQWGFDEWCVKSMTAISIKCRHNGTKDVQKELTIELQTNRKLGRRSEWG